MFSPEVKDNGGIYGSLIGSKATTGSKDFTSPGFSCWPSMEEYWIRSSFHGKRFTRMSTICALTTHGLVSEIYKR